MPWLKVIVGSSNALLLCAGLAVWVAGAAAGNTGRRKLGTTLLGAWLVYDLLTVILAFSLGWFA